MYDVTISIINWGDKRIKMDRYGLITAMLLSHAAQVSAQDISTAGRFAFDMYGTIGVVHSSEDRADFTSDRFDPEGVGRSDSLSPEIDSRLGLQMAVDLTPKLSAVVQAVVEQRYDNTYEPSLEWANLKYQFTRNFSLRAGRLVLPTFMISDYRKVGYTIPWVRPPVEVYRIVPISNTNGLEANYRFNLGDYSNTLRVIYGRKDIQLPDTGGEVLIRDAWTVTDTFERGDATLSLSYSNGRLTLESFNPLFDAFRPFGPEGATIADRYNLDGKRIEIFNVGTRYDPGDWFVMGEWARSESQSFLGTSHGWYVSGGYRFGSVTPYITYGRTSVQTSTTVPGLSIAGLPPALAGAAQGLNATLNNLLALAPEQQTFSLGARWDFARNFALKLQYDYMDLNRDSKGVLINPSPDFSPGGSVSLFSASLDFVY